MSKHTPGPWEARKGSYSQHSEARPDMMDFACSVDCAAPFRDDAEGSDQYGETFETQACARAYGRSKEEMLANARLIAAAPELLEALAFAQKASRLAADRSRGWPSQLTNAIDAALAKARGES